MYAKGKKTKSRQATQAYTNSYYFLEWKRYFEPELHARRIDHRYFIIIISHRDDERCVVINYVYGYGTQYRINHPNVSGKTVEFRFDKLSTRTPSILWKTKRNRKQ